MKVVLLSLLVCALASTGLSYPVENEKLPPIGGFLIHVHPVILNLAKETLSRVQDNLHSAGRVEEALHLNKFITETERILNRGKDGAVGTEEAFDFEDHLNSIYSVLEKYKEFLPVEKKKKSFITLGNLVDLNSKDEYYLRELKRVRDVLATVVDNLRIFGFNAKAKWLYGTVATAESLIERLENHKLDTKNLYHFLEECDRRIATYSELYNSSPVNPSWANQNHEYYLDQLKRVRDELFALRRNLIKHSFVVKSRVVHDSVESAEALLERLENHKLDTTNLQYFLDACKRVIVVNSLHGHNLTK